MGISLRDVFRPGSPYTARELLQLISELPDEGAFAASVKASDPPAADVSKPEVLEFRHRRGYRGWTTDRALLALIADVHLKKPYPRPWDQDVVVRGRIVLELDEMP